MKVFSFCIFITLIVTGCSATKNYAPVRSYYQRDLARGNKYYSVKRGDTLYSIGFRSGHSYQDLARWNNISSPHTLYLGQKIRLFNLNKNRKQQKRVRKKYQITSKKRTSSHKRPTKGRTTSQKRSTNSNDNKKVLKLIWQWPIKNKILKNFSQTGRKGIDIYGKMGQKIKSAASGKVVYSGNGLKGYGNLLIIKHNYLYLSAYANNSRLHVKEGEHVNKGQVIAEVGRVSGKKTSLHFEIRKNGKPVNPLRYLPKL